MVKKWQIVINIINNCKTNCCIKKYIIMYTTVSSDQIILLENGLFMSADNER